ncbi:MAG: (2Fe-2S)-binding protein [Granulosicoccus sp.]
MSQGKNISFKVNGSAVEVQAAEDTPLVYVLRNDLKLTGTRFGCGEGHCGACTVTIDGRAVQSCTMPVSFASNRAVETIEGLLGDPLHPIVEAIQSHNAWQCGFCLAGIIMQARALHIADREITRQDIANALNDHLCRCGAHTRILDALSDVLCGEVQSAG